MKNIKGYVLFLMLVFCTSSGGKNKTDLSKENINSETKEIIVELHVSEKSSRETTEDTLKWVHIFISNAKRNLLGNYHRIKGKYLQAYLDEFVYKLNRRYFGERIFDRMVIAGITGL